MDAHLARPPDDAFERASLVQVGLAALCVAHGHRHALNDGRPLGRRRHDLRVRGALALLEKSALERIQMRQHR